MKGKELLLPGILLGMCGAVVLSLIVGPGRVSPGERRFGELLLETQSDYSHIRIRERDGVRRLTFVDAQGDEQLQSAIALEEPHVLQLRYTRSLLASLLLHPDQSRILIVGLGGGGMVHFFNHAFPDTLVEVVEIDPVVVELADSYFHTVEGPKTRIHTADAFQFVREDRGPFEVIYMDAFLKPPAESGLEEVTQRLKTESFLDELKQRLTHEGVLAFNLIESEPSTEEDLASIRAVFPAIYVFSVPGTGNLVVVATRKEEKLDPAELMRRARDLDLKWNFGFRFQDFAGHLRE